MTPQDIALVQNSFRKVLPIAGVAADLFYDRLFETAPELRALFPIEMSEQKQKLVQMLALSVNGLSQPEVLLPAVKALGRRHGAYGVKPDYYGTVGAALLHTLRQGLGEAFTPEVEAAWAETYGLLSSVMIAAQKESEPA